MKKVLIISYHFSKKESIGSIRIQGLAKYLPAFGWAPTIVTAKQPSGENQKFAIPSSCFLIETEFKDRNASLAKLFGINPNKPIDQSLKIKQHKGDKSIFDHGWNLTKEILCYPDPQKGWYKYAYEAGKKLLQEDRYDAIISSSFPVTSHIIARDLKRQFNIPWIADLRDLWTQNPYYTYSPFRKLIETQLEKRTLKYADALTTVSEPLRNILISRYEGKYVLSILNGFDPEEMNSSGPLNKCLSITYTGVLYRGRRDPEPLLKVLRELIDEGTLEKDDVSVDFYGRKESWLEDIITKYTLNDIVSQHGPVSREIAIKKQWESQILLLLTWNNPQEYGVYTGKVFDYLAAKRPILSLGLSGGVVAKILEETKAGFHASTEEDLKKYIINAYTSFINSGSVEYEGIQSKVSEYSHLKMVERFTDVLNHIVEKYP